MTFCTYCLAVTLLGVGSLSATYAAQVLMIELKPDWLLQILLTGSFFFLFKKMYIFEVQSGEFRETCTHSKLGSLKVWPTFPGCFNWLLTKINKSVSGMMPAQCVFAMYGTCWSESGMDTKGIEVTLMQSHFRVVGISSHNHLLGFQRTVSKREYSQWAGGCVHYIALSINVMGQRPEMARLGRQAAQRPQEVQELPATSRQTHNRSRVSDKTT